MKFLVDEMPFWQEDCPFYDKCRNICTLDDCECKYMASAPAGHRDAEECRWLKTTNGDFQE